MKNSSGASLVGLESASPKGGQLPLMLNWVRKRRWSILQSCMGSLSTPSSLMLSWRETLSYTSCGLSHGPGGRCMSGHHGHSRQWAGTGELAWAQEGCSSACAELHGGRAGSHLGCQLGGKGVTRLFSAVCALALRGEVGAGLWGVGGSCFRAEEGGRGHRGHPPFCPLAMSDLTPLAATRRACWRALLLNPCAYGLGACPPFPTGKP